MGGLASHVIQPYPSVFVAFFNRLDNLNFLCIILPEFRRTLNLRVHHSKDLVSKSAEVSSDAGTAVLMPDDVWVKTGDNNVR